MRRIGVGLVAYLLVVTLTTPAGAAANTYGPPYKVGPSGGDNHSMQSADPNTGHIMIFEDNLRQSAAVVCVGDGPRATLLARHPVAGPVSAVTVNYTDARLTQNVIIDVLVTGSRSGWLGHKAAFGEMEGESGALKVPIQGKPVEGEIMTVQFGLQVGPGCLPAQPVGLWGSRAFEMGNATFPSVNVS
jgi:hypothetical protein